MPGNLQDRQDLDEWKTLIIPHLAGGSNTDAPPDLIADEETPYSYNVRFRGRLVEVDTGYKTFGDTLRGVPRKVFEHITAAGVATLLLISDDSIYKFSTTQNEWQYVPMGDEAYPSSALDAQVITANMMAGTDTGVMDTPANFSVGDYIGITLNSGKQHKTRIATKPGAGVFTMDDVIPTGEQADIGNAIVNSVALSGSSDKQVVVVPDATDEWTIFTNGVDFPMYYDGTICEAVEGLNAAGLNLICDTLIMYKGQLLLGNTEEGGTRRVSRLRGSEIDDPTTWLSGNAFVEDLTDTRDDIIAMKPLANDLIIYRSQSIVRNEWVGEENYLHERRTMVHGISRGATGSGCVSANAVVNVGAHHVFLGRTGVFLYDGGFKPTKISQKINEKIFSERGEADRTNTGVSFLQYVEETTELWTFYATSGNTYPDRAAIVNMDTGAWRHRRFDDNITGAGVFVNTSFTTIADLVGTIAEQNWTYDGLGSEESSAHIALCGEADKQVFEYDYATPYDDGSTIDYIVSTKDFRGYDQLLRTEFFEFEVMGTNLVFLCSLDMGKTYSIMAALLGPGATMTRYRIAYQVVTEQIRLMVTGVSGGFALGSIAMHYTHESPYINV